MDDGLNIIVSERKASRDGAKREPDPMKGGDIYQWSMKQVALIRAGRYDDIDWINIADEIESLGKSEFRSLKSLIEIIVVHMLKWDHQPTKRSRSWINSIDESRDHVFENLSDNPSLKTRKEEAIAVAYRLGRRAAARQTELDAQTFPTTCPYDWDAIMTRPFVLDQTEEKF